MSSSSSIFFAIIKLDLLWPGFNWIRVFCACFYLFVWYFVGPNVRHKWKDLPGRFLKNSKPPMKQTISFNKRSPIQRRLGRPRRVRWVFWLFFHFPNGNNTAGCLNLADLIQLKLNKIHDIFDMTFCFHLGYPRCNPMFVSMQILIPMGLFHSRFSDDDA